MIKNAKLVNYDLYEIYEDGRVYSKYWKKYLTDKQKPPKMYIDNEYTSIDGERIHVLRHDLIWYYFKGEIPKNMEIDHIIPIKDGGDPKALSNLRLVSHGHNMNNPYTVERLRQANLGEKNPMYGTRKTDEDKKRIGESVKKRWDEGVIDSRIPIDQIDKETGEVIKTWKSATDCAKQTDFKQAGIWYALKGGRYYKGKWVNIYQYKGFIWKEHKHNKHKRNKKRE